MLLETEEPSSTVTYTPVEAPTAANAVVTTIALTIDPKALPANTVSHP